MDAALHAMVMEHQRMSKQMASAGIVMALAIFIWKRKVVSRFFVLSEDGIGPGGDIIFRKCHTEYQWYNVCLDDEKIGQVMLDTRRRWIGLSNAEESEWFKTRTLDGFATRYDAATFVIKHNGYWMGDERRLQEDTVRVEKFIYNWNMKKSYNIMSGVDSL